MVASALGEASGKIWSRTSPREEDAAEDEGEALGALAAFTDGNVSVRTEAGVGAATGELFGCATEELGGGDTGFFSGAAFSEFCFADGDSGFAAGGTSRREGC